MPLYKLEPAIPINKPIRGNAGPSKHFDYPFGTMDFEDNNTFLIPLIAANFDILPDRKKSIARKLSDRVRHQAKRFAKNFKPEFEINTRKRYFKEHGEVGIRVWRVK